MLASFLNFSAVVGHLSALNDDFTIVCSGKLNDFCVEDSVYAGLLIAKLFELNSKSNYTLLDSGYISYQLAKQLIYKNAKPDQHRVFNMFKKSEHGKYLVSLGFEKDLEYCSNIDSFKNLPTFKNNIIKLKETFDSEATEKSKMKRINISNKSGSSKE